MLLQVPVMTYEERTIEVQVPRVVTEIHTRTVQVPRYGRPSIIPTLLVTLTCVIFVEAAEVLPCLPDITILHLH